LTNKQFGNRKAKDLETNGDVMQRDEVFGL